MADEIEGKTPLIYIVIRCARCRQPITAKKAQRSRTCPYCGIRNRVDPLIVEAATESMNEAIKVTAKLRKAIGHNRDSYTGTESHIMRM